MGQEGLCVRSGEKSGKERKRDNIHEEEQLHRKKAGGGAADTGRRSL